MQLHRFDDAEKFSLRVGGYLRQQEVNHNVLLRLCHTLVHNPERYPESNYMAMVELEGTVVAVAIRTPPFPLLLSHVSDLGAIKLITQDVLICQPELPGVNGPSAEADCFARYWQELTDQGYSLQMALRVHQLEAVQPIAPTTGFLRPVSKGDRDLLLKWYYAFELEALGKTVQSEQEAERWFTSHLKRETAFLWQDGEPVSLACIASSTKHTACFNMVYTPPEHRKHGYASACVAALSQRTLDQGFQFCCLFTDLANPTSNKIYRAIGFEPVCDWNNYSFRGV